MSITPSDPQAVAARFQAWVEARRADPADPDLVDDAVDAGATSADVRRLGLRPGALLFTPEASAGALTTATDATIVSYTGEIATTGSEVEIGDDLLVQFESYSTVEYLALVCPTAVSIDDEVDLGVLRGDIERASAEGLFPGHLLNPLVTFRGLAEILSWDPASREPRLSDVVRDALEAPEGRRVRRFVAAIRLLQLASSRVSAPLAVSGFGHPFLEVTADHADSDAPFVLRSDDGTFYVGDARRGRFGVVPRAVAEIVEAVTAETEPSTTVTAAVGITRWSTDAAATLFGKLGLELPRREASHAGA